MNDPTEVIDSNIEKLAAETLERRDLFNKLLLERKRGELRLLKLKQVEADKVKARAKIKRKQQKASRKANRGS